MTLAERKERRNVVPADEDPQIRHHAITSFDVRPGDLLVRANGEVAAVITDVDLIDRRRKAGPTTFEIKIKGKVSP